MKITKEEYFELLGQMELEAAEFAKGKDESLRNICEYSFSIGALRTLKKFLK